jgi:hypothetical protein
MLDESQGKALQHRQKIKMFFGTPNIVAENVNAWVEATSVHITEQKIEVFKSNNTVVVSVLYMHSSAKNAATAAQTLPSGKGQQPVINMEAIKAAYEQS